MYLKSLITIALLAFAIVADATPREREDERLANEYVMRVIVPLVESLGAQHLRHPYRGGYDHEAKTLHFGLGHKRHGDKRHRTSVTFEGMHYAEGEKHEGPTRTVELDRRIGWSRLHDNRETVHNEVVTVSILSFEEWFNKLRTFTSVDLVQSLSISGSGSIAGFGGSVTSNSSVSVHTEIETEKFDHKKRETKIDDTVELEHGLGFIYLTERPVLVLQTSTPITQFGEWDARIKINLYDWSGNYGPMKGGEHKNELVFAGSGELISFIQGDLILQYPWTKNWKRGKALKAGLVWLREKENRHVGPVEWDRIFLNENVSALQTRKLSAAEANLN